MFSFPPSGHVAGVYAFVLITSAVFKAPASGKTCAGALGLRFQISLVSRTSLNLGAASTASV